MKKRLSKTEPNITNMKFHSCKGKKPISDENCLKALVKEYLDIYGNACKTEDRWWGDKTLNWNQAIERAWNSRFEDGKMHPHQYRVSKRLSDGIKVALADNIHAESFKDFESLYTWVLSVVNRIHGLGKLTAYDVAIRLSIWLQLKPVVVYLHAGTADGAKKFDIQGDTAPLSKFPQEIQALGTTHAENFLCIYKQQIWQLQD